MRAHFENDPYGAADVVSGLGYPVMAALSPHSRGPAQPVRALPPLPVLNTPLGGMHFVVTGLQQSTWPLD